MSDSATPQTAAHHTPPSLGFSRQEPSAYKLNKQPLSTECPLTTHTHLLTWQRRTGHHLGPTYRINPQVSGLGPTHAALCSPRPPFPSTPTHPARASLSVLSSVEPLNHAMTLCLPLSWYNSPIEDITGLL